MRHNPALDGLRGIAILFVFIGHIFSSHLHVAWTGVEIFFVLSGYLITGTLLQHNDYVYFYKRRALRILPALFIFLFVFLIVSYLLNIAYSSPFLFASVFFYSNWIFAFNIEPSNYLTHLWSLAVEEQFYLVFPWLLILFARYPRVLLLCFILCFCYKWHFFHVEWSFRRIYYGTDTRMASFLLGAILYFIHIDKIRCKIPFKPVYVHYLSGLAFLLLLLISLYGINKNNFYWAFLSNLWIAILIYFSYDQHLVVNRILSCRILRWIGQLSFGLYLWHYPVVRFLRADYPWYVVVGVGLPLTFLCAYLSYRYIEKPLLQREKNKFLS